MIADHAEMQISSKIPKIILSVFITGNLWYADSGKRKTASGGPAMKKKRVWAVWFSGTGTTEKIVHVVADEPVVGVGGHLCGVDDREPLVAADALAAVIDRGVVEQVTRFGLGRREFVRVDVEPVAAGV